MKNTPISEMTPERLRVELQSSMNGNDLLTAESIRYRKRAEVAEGKLKGVQEDLISTNEVLFENTNKAQSLISTIAALEAKIAEHEWEYEELPKSDQYITWYNSKMDIITDGYGRDFVFTDTHPCWKPILFPGQSPEQKKEYEYACKGYCEPCETVDCPERCESPEPIATPDPEGA